MLHLTSSLADLARLYPWLDEQAKPLGVPAPLLASMHVVLEEVVANAVLHGFPPGACGEILVEIDRQPGAIVVAVTDDGIAFDPATAPLRPPATEISQLAPGGWGLGLIRGLCPDLRYTREDGRNRLVMRFALAPA